MAMEDRVIKQLVQKIDLRVIPLLTLLYLFSYLDRMNIANARLFNLEADLKLSGEEYSWCVSIIFLSYAISAIPSNFFMGKCSPSVWIGTLMLLWGLILISMVFVNNAAGLLVTRFLMGIVGAGFFPGIIFYISLWYSRKDQVLRIGIFFCGAILAGAFGGILAYVIGLLENFDLLKGWQWIFLLEGIPTIGLSLLTYKILSNFPRDVTWLNVVEKELLVNHLRNDVQFLEDSHNNILQKQIWSVLSDWKVWLYIVLHFCCVTPIYSISCFLPTMIHSMNITASTSQLLSVPPHIASCITCLIASWTADRWNERGFHILIFSLVGVIGYLYLAFSPKLLYPGTFVACIGVFGAYPLNVSWFAYNIVGTAKRSLAVSFILGCGTLGGISVGQIYTDSDKPNYRKGHLTMVGCLILNMFMALLMKCLLRRANLRQLNRAVDQNEPVLNQMFEPVYLT